MIPGSLTERTVSSDETQDSIRKQVSRGRKMREEKDVGRERG